MLPRRFTSTFAAWTVALLCLFPFSMMLWASRTDSAIDDELAHIPAGYGYVHNLDYRLNPEHPPLVKALAMLPVLFLNPTPTFPTQNAAWTTAVNGQWDMGRAFLYESGNDANAIIQWARIMPILLTILTIIFLFLLARWLLGPMWALLPTALFALSPTVLAHGHYVTTDIGATFGIVFATYFFLKFLNVQHPDSKFKALFFAGLAFGVAQLTKFSTPFLVPLFLFAVFILWLREVITRWSTVNVKTFAARGCRYLWQTLAIFAIGYILIVYPVYALFTAHYPIARQVGDTTAILTSFANGPTPAGQSCHLMRCLADFDIWAAHNPVLRPFAEYLLGLLMVLQRSTAGNTIYFLGHVVNSGGWTYFPTLYLLKEPIPSLIIVLVALFLATWNILRNIRAPFSVFRSRFSDYLHTHVAEFTMASFIVLYWGYSMRSPLNIGIRHILPTLPFIYILAAGVWKKFSSFRGFNREPVPSPSREILAAEKIPRQARDDATMPVIFSNIKKILIYTILKYIILVALIIWLLAETLFAAPYFLSYFNEFGGGVNGGYHYVTDSNYDWGQDLLRLRAWVSAHPEMDKIAVDYFGGGDPKYYLGAKAVDWPSSKGNPVDQNIHWFAVSVNQLQGGIQPLANGPSTSLGTGQTRNPADEYSWLTALRPPAAGLGNVPQPDYRVGTTIFIYHL